MLIIIIGPKHTGKTITGQSLAVLAGMAFSDLDELVTQREGETPRDLFHRGAEVFRRAEAAALESLLAAGGKRVISAGGGLIDNTAAVNLLTAADDVITVYLELSADEAWRRIKAAGPLPPFLEGPDPRENHRQLHERRAEAYRRLANLTVNVEGKTPGAIASEIFHLVKPSDTV